MKRSPAGIAWLVAAGALARALSAQEATPSAPTPGPTLSPTAVPPPAATPTPVSGSSFEPTASARGATATPAPAEPPEEGAPAAPTPGPTALPSAPALRIVEPSALPVSTLPAENPFGSVPETPAGPPPPRPQAPKSIERAALFAALRVDANGRVLSARRVRDPIPSISAETDESLARWVFEPGRRAGQPTETWAAVRIDLAVEIDTPKIEQITLDPVTPSTPIPTPFAWPTDTAWLEAVKASPPTDGTVPIEQLDLPPVPRKTPWSADSYKGPFSVRFWVRVGASGRVERAFPLGATDPVLIGYFRKAMEGWTFRPARSGGAPVSTWNELTFGGQVSYSVDIKQIASLRQSL